MALIKSQLVLTDGMTGPLKSINKAMNIVLNSFEAMQEQALRWTSWKTIRINRPMPSAASRKLSGL